MLRERAVAAFDQASAALGDDPAAEPVRALLREQRGRLLATLRVALVGRVSSGKSTLANALLGGHRVATGATELTYNVNWLRYGDEPQILVHFLDGRPVQRHELADLERMTVSARHDPAHQDFLSRIDYIEVHDSNPRLLDFDLIDTPGLDSHFRADSANTLRFLGRTGDEVRAATVAQASQADALVLVFARGLARGEAELMADFRGAALAAVTPITAIGALTKVELYWPEHDPMDEGRRVADKLMRAAGARRLLFDLRPIASLVAAGASTLTDAEFADLTALARLPPGVLAERVRLGPLFATKEQADLPVPAARRQALFSRLGGYGIVLSCGLVRDGVDRLAVLGAELAERSGLAAFRELLTGHFGNRADLIKLRRAMTVLQEQQELMRPALPPRARLRADDAAAEVTRMGFAEHAFEELTVLQRYYDGQLEFGDGEAAELLRITGEHGTTPAARLGQPASASAEALRARARERFAYWAAYTVDPSHGGPTRRAAQTVQRSYELLIGEIAAGPAGQRRDPRPAAGAA
ncbi:MAG TPA: dynamin family protein [Streptosporangiaceae bacterium]|nr:dynamin family protein [Streptosporangiaceae bacterium]